MPCQQMNKFRMGAHVKFPLKKKKTKPKSD